jgi:MFS family permease
MIGHNYFHAVAKLSRKFLGLAIVQAVVAFPNIMANGFTLVYLQNSLGSVGFCALFIALEALTAVLLLLFAARFIARNIELCLTTSLLVLATYYGLLGSLSGYYLLLAAPFFGIYIILFWVPYQTLVTHIVDKTHIGVETASYFAVFPLISVIAPSLGGLWIDTLGFRAIFLLACAFLVFAHILIRRARAVSLKLLDVKLKELISTLKLTASGRIQVDIDLRHMSTGLKASLFSQGIQEGVFWIAVPLVGIIQAGSVTGLGHLLSLFALMGATMTMMLGYASDRIKKRRVFAKSGAFLIAVACLILGLSPTIGVHQFGISLAVVYLAMPLVSVFLFIETTETFMKECKKGILIRELMLNSGRFLGALGSIIIVLLGFETVRVFILSGIALGMITYFKG